MENPFTQRDNIFDLKIDDTARGYLRTAATWAKIIAIAGFVSAGLTILELIIQGAGTGTYEFIAGFLLMLLFMSIGVVVNIFLYRFASNTLKGLNTISQVQFNEGVNNLRIYYKLIGIIFIICISLIILFTLLFMIGLSLRG